MFRKSPLRPHTTRGSYSKKREKKVPIVDVLAIIAALFTIIYIIFGLGWFAPGLPNEIKIALLVPMSGDISAFGESTRDGALLAIEEWNTVGGVLGRKIVPIIEDSQCSPDLAVNYANQVINEDQVHYIIGEVCSSASIAISGIAQEHNVVQISPASTRDTLTLNQDGSTKQYVFRAAYHDSFQGVVTARFSLENLHARSAFILYDPGSDYSTGLADNFFRTFRAGGGSITGEEVYSSWDIDFSAILAKVAAANPDVIFLGDNYPVINRVTAQAKEMGIEAPFIGGDGWDSDELDWVSADGSYFSNPFSTDDPHPIVQDWIKKYQKKYGSTPDDLAALGYDATNLLLAAIRRAGVDEPEKVKDALASLRWKGITGDITFDPQHNPVKDAVIMQVKAGQIRFVDTVSP